MRTALAFNLNPLKREVHFIPVNNDIKIVVGYEVYLKRAEKSGKLDGWKVDLMGEEGNLKAVVTIHRKDWEKPFVHESYFNEVRQNSPLWTKMPRFMLKKVAIAQAFRLAFPEELGGMPYMPEEIGMETQTNENQKINPVTMEMNGIENKKTVVKTASHCAHCGKSITQAVRAYSEQKYKKSLCMTCQKNQQAGAIAR